MNTFLLWFPSLHQLYMHSQQTFYLSQKVPLFLHLLIQCLIPYLHKSFYRLNLFISIYRININIINPDRIILDNNIRIRIFRAIHNHVLTVSDSLSLFLVNLSTITNTAISNAATIPNAIHFSSY